MKKALVIGLLAALLCGCTKAVEQKYFCVLTLQTELSDGRVPVSITVDPTLPGNQFRNLNTGIEYPFPTLVNNFGLMEVQKGVYIVAFDGDALFSDGSHATVRFTEWGTPSSAITLMENTQTLVLKLTVLK
jgi:hypothetical protein